LRVESFSDVQLARRLECAEGVANARFVETRAQVDASVGAAWIDVDGTYAMFDGVDSPCTQTFGFGLFAPPSADTLDAIERFYDERHAPVCQEVCPLADPSHLELLGARRYRPIELSTVLYRETNEVVTAASASPAVTRVAARLIAAEESSVWARTFADGWRDEAGVSDLIEPLAHVSASRADARLFLVEEAGRAIAAGSLAMTGGVALLSGASTVPAARGRGAQSALMAARLAYAAQQGCDIAMVVALPGSGSQRNAERNGFRIAYTRTKWRLFR
jgi:GNAT superfamily N-acetyltransferase